MRFLCLHGMGTNGKIFEVQTAKLRLGLGGEHEYVFVDGNVPATAAPGVKQFAGSNDEFLCFAEEGDVHGYLTLYENLKLIIVEEGPFDAIMGFSEGAAVAASLIVDHIRRTSAGETSPFAFKCAIFFCAANPVDSDAVQRGSIELLDAAVVGQVIAIPTAHIWALSDDVHPGFGESLSALCSDLAKEEYVHNLGHAVPGAQSAEGVFEATRAVRRTIERAMEQFIFN